MKVQTVLDIAVEFPEDGEIINSSHYHFRLWAADARSVSISIDGGPWLACHPDVGYWWHEWTGYSNGRHWVAARMRDDEGRLISARPQRFSVDLAESESELELEELER